MVTLDDVIAPGTSGDIAGMLVPDGNGNAFVRTLDASLIAASSTTPIAVSTDPAWKLWSLTLGDTPTATVVQGSPATNGRSVLQDVGDVLLVPDYFGTDARTALRVMRGEAQAHTSVQGQVRSVAKVR